MAISFQGTEKLAILKDFFFYCIEISVTNTEFSIRVTKKSFDMANFGLSEFFFCFLKRIFYIFFLSECYETLMKLQRFKHAVIHKNA